MKIFTKKAFRSALKANDQTEIWHLTAVKLGRRPERLEVLHLVEELSTTNRDYKKAWSLAFRDNYCRRGAQQDAIFIQRGGVRQYDDSHYRSAALAMLRNLLTEKNSNYTKVPMMGHTHLYFCSPSYGHADYNKVRTCAIEGNEDFVKKILDIADRKMKKEAV
jgi:hypothetical protein